MSAHRLEAFSDGVMAVIITITALEIRVPHGTNLAALRHEVPLLLIYALSFAYIGIYWNNHHHLLRVTQNISGAVMWANLHLLFWLSLIPVLTQWMGNNYRDTEPAVCYGVAALAAATAYSILVRTIITANPRSDISDALGSGPLGRDTKGRVSILLYALAVGLAFVSPYIAYGLFTTVSVMWFVPDRRLVT